ARPGSHSPAAARDAPRHGAADPDRREERHRDPRPSRTASRTMTTVTPTDDGPYMVEGDLRIVDPLGNEYDLGGAAAVFLCRCGRSATKPFCDGTHERVRFEAAGRAPRDLVAAATVT